MVNRTFCSGGGHGYVAVDEIMQERIDVAWEYEALENAMMIELTYWLLQDTARCEDSREVPPL